MNSSPPELPSFPATLLQSIRGENAVQKPPVPPPKMTPNTSRKISRRGKNLIRNINTDRMKGTSKSPQKISCGPKGGKKKRRFRRRKMDSPTSRRASIQKILNATSKRSFVGGRKKSIEEIKKNVRRKSMQRRKSKEKGWGSEATGTTKKTRSRKKPPPPPKPAEALESFPGMDADDDMEAFPGLDKEGSAEPFPEPSSVPLRGRPPSIPKLPNRLARLQLHSAIPDDSSSPDKSKRPNARRASTVIRQMAMKEALAPELGKQTPGPSNFSKLLSNLCDAVKEIRAQHEGFLANLKRFTQLYVDGSLEEEDFVMVVSREMPKSTKATKAIQQAVIRELRGASDDSSYDSVKKFVTDKFGEEEFVYHKNMIQKLLNNRNSLKRSGPPPPPRSFRSRGPKRASRSLSTPAFKPMPKHQRSVTAMPTLSALDAATAKPSRHQRTRSVVVTSPPTSPVVPTTATAIPPSLFSSQADSDTSETWRTFSNTPAIATLFSNLKAVAISNQNFAAMLNSGLLPGQAALVVESVRVSSHDNLDHKDLSEALMSLVRNVHRALTSSPELFRLYAQYSTCYGPSMDEFQSTLNGPTTEELRGALEKFRNALDKSNLTLMDYLIMPVQQMFKHRLLLKKLASSCSKLCAKGAGGEEGGVASEEALVSVVGTEMVPLVARCLEVLDLACAHIDSLVNQAEEYQALKLIQKQFSDKLMLTRRGRCVVKKGQMQMSRLRNAPTGQASMLSRQKSFYKTLSQHANANAESAFSLRRRGSRRHTATRRPRGSRAGSILGGRDRRNTSACDTGGSKTHSIPVCLHLFNDLLVISSSSKATPNKKVPRSPAVNLDDAHAYERSFLQQQQKQLQVSTKRRGEVRTLLMAVNIEDCAIVERQLDSGDNEFAISASDKRTMLFQVSSGEERKEWVQALERVKGEAGAQQSQSLSSLPPGTAAVWIDDDQAQACAVCAKRFTTFIRRHHCRNCGLVVCTKCSQARRVLKSHGAVGVRVCDSCDDWRERYLNAEAEGDAAPNVAPTLAGTFYGHKYIRWPPLSPTGPDVKEGMVCLSGKEHQSSSLAFVLGVTSFDLTLPVPNLRAPFFTLFLDNELVGQGMFECKGDATRQGSIWTGKNLSILTLAKQKNKDKSKAPNVAFICHVPISALPTTSLTLRVFHQPSQFGKVGQETCLGSAEIPLLELVSHFELADAAASSGILPLPSRRPTDRFGSRVRSGSDNTRLAGHRWRKNKRFHPADIVRSCSAVALPILCEDEGSKGSPPKSGAARAAAAMRKQSSAAKCNTLQIGTAHLSFDVGTPGAMRDGDGRDIIRTIEQFCDIMTPEMRQTVMAPKLMRTGLNQYFRICFAEAQCEVRELQAALDTMDAGSFDDTDAASRGYSSALGNLVLNSDDLSADLHRCSERFNRLMWICDEEKDANSLLSLQALESLGEGGVEGLFACQVYPAPLLSSRTTSLLLPPEWKEMFQKELLFLRNMLALEVVWGSVIRAVRDNADLAELEQSENDISKRLQMHLHSDQARAILHDNSGVHIAVESARHIYTVHRAMVCALYRAFADTLPEHKAAPDTPPADIPTTLPTTDDSGLSRAGKRKSHRRNKKSVVSIDFLKGGDAEDGRPRASVLLDVGEEAASAPSEDRKGEHFDAVTAACVPIICRYMSLFQVYSSFASHCMDVCVCFSLPTFAAYRKICVQKHAAFLGSASGAKNRRHFGTSMIWLQPVTHLQWFEKFLLSLKDKLQQRHKDITPTAAANAAKPDKTGAAEEPPPSAADRRQQALEMLTHMHSYIHGLRLRLRNLLAESDSKNVKI